MSNRKPRSPRSSKAAAIPPAAKPEKVAQPHGGALYKGGVPGHDGSNAGRRKSEVRAALIEGAERAVPKLIAMLDDDRGEIVQGAADKLLKYGIGTQKELTVTQDDIRDRVRKTLDLLRSRLEPEMFEGLMPPMREIWR